MHNLLIILICTLVLEILGCIFLIYMGIRSANQGGRVHFGVDLIFGGKLGLGAATHIGNRSYQQDAYYVPDEETCKRNLERGVIGVLCDGMGGMQSGEIASSLCVSEVVKSFYSASPNVNISGFFKDTIRQANQMVRSLKTNGAASGEAGTTLACVVIRNERLNWASVGDSRIYLVREGKIYRLTQDHSYYNELLKKVKAGEMALEDAQKHPQREALTSYIGMRKENIIDSNKKEYALRTKDVIMICSDGLYRTLSETEMYTIITTNQNDINETATRLVETAIGKGRSAQDNTTVVLLKYVK